MDKYYESPGSTAARMETVWLCVLEKVAEINCTWNSTQGNLINQQYLLSRKWVSLFSDVINEEISNLNKCRRVMRRALNVLYIQGRCVRRPFLKQGLSQSKLCCYNKTKCESLRSPWHFYDEQLQNGKGPARVQTTSHITHITCFPSFSYLRTGCESVPSKQDNCVRVHF